MNSGPDIAGFEGDSAVHASAGTGKTTLLVEKFFRLLMRKKGGHYTKIDWILAITFTDKSADDMRRRISERIFKEISKWETAERGPERLAATAHLVVSQRRLTHAYISTIHSFCARVLRENPIEAGIDPMFEIMDEQRSSVLESDALINFLLAKLKNGAIFDLAYRYGFTGEGEFEASVVQIIKKIFPLVRAADMDRRAMLSLARETAEAADAKLSKYLGEALALCGALSDFAKNAKASEIAIKIHADLELLKSVAFSDRETAVRVSGRLPKTLNLTSFRNCDDAKKLKEILEELHPWCVAPLALEPASRLAELADEFKAHYSRNVKKRESLDYDDLQELTLNLFRRHTEIRERYRQLFQGVLVDEFQDVNRLQKEIIYSFAPPGDGKLFVVGDPKQAIYGFRGGDSQGFADAKNEISSVGGGLFKITKNYRSRPEIVNFVNRFFEAHGEMGFGDDDVSTAHREPLGSTAVERLTFPPLKSADDNRFMEARLVAQRILQMTADGRRFGDIVLLFRKLTALPLYESAFNGAGIPTAVYKGTGFFQSQEVADMISALALIDNPGDLVSWVATIRSPLVACSDETVLSLRRGRDGKLRNASPAPDATALKKLVPNDLEREKYSDFCRWYERILVKKDRLTISETIEAVLEESGFIGVLNAQYGGVQKAANVLKLIELGRAMESDGPAALKNFVRRLTALADGKQSGQHAVVALPEQNNVRIMTIHQAKGLEFPVVFMMDIDGSGGGPPAPVAFDQHAGLAVKYVDGKTLRSYTGADFKAISKLDEKKRREDGMRLFYVGCTRAEERLVLSGCYMARKSVGIAAKADALAQNEPNLFCKGEPLTPASFASQDFLTPYDVLSKEPSDGAEGKSDASPEQKRAPSVVKGYVSVGDLTTFSRCKRKYLFNNLMKIPAPIIKTTAKKSSLLPPAEFGSVAHSIIEDADMEASHTAFKKFVRKESAERLSHYPPSDRNAVARCVLNVLEFDVIKKLREGRLKLVGREIPFACKFDDGSIMEGKIDLLLRDEKGNPVVADYKFSLKQPDASTRLQTELYALAVSKMTGAESAACALLYAKGKPRQYVWTIDSKRLAEVGRFVSLSTVEITNFERQCRDDKMTSTFAGSDGLKCPDPTCAYSAYCHAAVKL